MPISPSALGNLVQSNVDAQMASISGVHPLAQQNPSYYIEFSQAIGQGIVLGGPSINYTTIDTGLEGAPMITGIGSGIGIVTDPTFFVQDLYTRIRNMVIADFGHTLHAPYPPPSGNSGQYLLAFCQGINLSFLNYYPTAWTLSSVHPQIYAGAGVIPDGHFSGLSAASIQSSITSLGPNLRGPFWPRIAQAVSESYVALIEQHSTGSVIITGFCVPSVSQTCGISGSGTGTGVAI